MLQGYRLKIFGRKFSVGWTVLATHSLEEVLLERILALKLTILRSEREEKLVFLEEHFSKYNL